MPKIRHLGSSHPSYALRARSAGAPRLRIRIDSSLAQNPNPQRLRRRFLVPKNGRPKKQGHKHPQMCFLLLFLFGACVLRKSIVKFYSLPTQCVENVAGGFA